MTHRLRVEPKHFAAIRSGEQTVEIRRQDRRDAFKVGDTLLLRAYNYELEAYCAGVQIVKVTHILRHRDCPQGISPGFVVMSIKKQVK